MKFKVGDKVKGLSNKYGITNTNMYLGEVKKVGDGYIEILILRHKDSSYVGIECYVLSPEGKFEIVKNKNGKFFKSLPNNFTGTLEVENGYIVEKEILDDVEKEYLSVVIRPFKDKVKYIAKYGDSRLEFISIKLVGDSAMLFPYFKKGTMYKGMELEKQYTLKELGLDE